MGRLFDDRRHYMSRSRGENAADGRRRAIAAGGTRAQRRPEGAAAVPQKRTLIPPHPPIGAPGARKRWTLMGSANALKLSAPPVAYFALVALSTRPQISRNLNGA